MLSVISSLIIIIVILLTSKDNNKYSTMECMENYKYFTEQLSKYDEGSDSWCEIKYILDNGFFIDKDSIIHERPNLIEVIEASKDLY
jgi:hypothetical protein